MSLEVGKEYYYPYYLNMTSKNDSIYLGRAHKIKIIEAEIKNDYVARAICFSVAGLNGLHYTFDKTSIYEIDSLSEKLFNQYELDDKESTRAEFMKNSKRAWS